MLGYLQFVSAIGTHGNSWLYSNIPYKLGLPPNAVINQWQLAVRQDRLQSYVNSLVPQHPQYTKMYQALRDMLVNNRPWPQVSNGPDLYPDQLSNDIPVLREILMRTDMLTHSAPVAQVRRRLARNEPDDGGLSVGEGNNRESLVATSAWDITLAAGSTVITQSATSVDGGRDCLQPRSGRRGSTLSEMAGIEY